MQKVGDVVTVYGMKYQIVKMTKQLHGKFMFDLVRIFDQSQWWCVGIHVSRFTNLYRVEDIRHFNPKPETDPLIEFNHY